jgi:hypothetical protein
MGPAGVKSRLRNGMTDESTDDAMVTSVEKDILDSVDNNEIIDKFKIIKDRKILL